jgi:Pentapeptide repeats (8 copies)/HD domain
MFVQIAGKNVISPFKPAFSTVRSIKTNSEINNTNPDQLKVPPLSVRSKRIGKVIEHTQDTIGFGDTKIPFSIIEQVVDGKPVKYLEAEVDWRAMGRDSMRDSGERRKAELIQKLIETAKRQGVKLDLVGANLGGVKLKDFDLSNANLEGADLYEANLSGANLKGANLKRAILYEANLSGADLSEVDLEEANLTNANFTNAKLIGAKLIGAKLWAGVLNPTVKIDSIITVPFLEYLLDLTLYKFKEDLQNKNVLRNVLVLYLEKNPEETINVINEWEKTLTLPNEKKAWNNILEILQIPEILAQKRQALGRVEELAKSQSNELPTGICLKDENRNIIGTQVMAFQHLPETTEKVIQILLNKEELNKQLLNPRSELSTLLPELLNYTPEFLINEFNPNKKEFSVIQPSGPYQHSYHKYQNLLKHTLKVIQSVQESNTYKSSTKEEQIIMTLAALCHDLGKPTAMKKNIAQADDSHGSASVKLAYQIADRLNLPYSIKREIAEMVSLKEELTKLTEKHYFKLPYETKLHELAVRIGSEKNLERIFILGESDSFRVRDDLAYWNSYEGNRQKLIKNLLPIIKRYEHLNFPIISEVDKLIKHTNQRTLKTNNGSVVQLIDLRNSNENYAVNLHVTNELRDNQNSNKPKELNREAVEENSLLCLTYSNLPNSLRIFNDNSNALIMRTTPVNIDTVDVYSGNSKNLLRLGVDEPVQNSIRQMAFHKFEIIQREFIPENERVNSQDIVTYFDTNKIPENINQDLFKQTIKQIEEINKLLNYYQKYSTFPFGIDTKLTQKVETTIKLFSELVVKFDNHETMQKANYNQNNQGTPLEINEINGFRNELAAVLIRVPPEMNDEQLTAEKQKEIQFAIKHNIPIVLQKNTE